MQTPKNREGVHATFLNQLSCLHGGRRESWVERERGNFGRVGNSSTIYSIDASWQEEHFSFLHHGHQRHTQRPIHFSFSSKSTKPMICAIFELHSTLKCPSLQRVATTSVTYLYTKMELVRTLCIIKQITRCRLVAFILGNDTCMNTGTFPPFHVNFVHKFTSFLMVIGFMIL